MEEKIKEMVCCPISKEMMTDPVIISSGHTYDRDNIKQWFSFCEEKQNPYTDPMTNQELVNTNLIPNIFTRQIIKLIYPDKKCKPINIETSSIYKIRFDDY